MAAGLPRRALGVRSRVSPRTAALPVLLVIALLSGCANAKQTPTGVFGQYPHSPALDAAAQVHAEAASDPREELLLLTTWFLDGDPRVAMTCRVRPDGHVSTFGYVYEQ